MDSDGGENEKVIPVYKENTNLATDALCCMSLTNPFRKRIVDFTINKNFDSFILFIILLNCIFLALENEEYYVTLYAKEIDRTFLIIYTIEMVLKIIAMGFFMRKFSYLRDNWNILDFIVVILGWITA